MDINSSNSRAAPRLVMARWANTAAEADVHNNQSGMASHDEALPTQEIAATREEGNTLPSPTAVTEFCSTHQYPLGGWAKRGFDLMVTAVALVLAAPLMLLVAILIKATSGGAILFAHQRIGFNGQPFSCYKFCTMVPNADRVLADYLASHAGAAYEWNSTQKLKNDPRVTFLGHLLRKSSIDELPQLLNVLRGEMSCVGPRPVVAEELQRYGEFAGDYLKVRPGLTGIWQVSGRSLVDYSTRVQLDVEYIRNWSLAGDIAILARTAVVVMKFEQAS